MRTQSAVCAALLAFLFSGPAAAGLEDALRLYDAGDEAGARALLAAAAAEDVYYLALTQRGDERKASLARAAELTPADAVVLRGRIAAQRSLADGKPAVALTVLRDLAAREPRDKRQQQAAGAAAARGAAPPGGGGVRGPPPR